MEKTRRHQHCTRARASARVNPRRLAGVAIPALFTGRCGCAVARCSSTATAVARGAKGSCEAHYGLAAVLFHSVRMGFAEPEATMAEAYAMVTRALVLDDRNEYAHWAAGRKSARHIA